MSVVQHWVGGAAFAGASTRTAPVYNPATGVAQREVLLATTADVDHAVATAKAAFSGPLCARSPKGPRGFAADATAPRSAGSPSAPRRTTRPPLANRTED